MPTIQELLHGTNLVWVAERLFQLGLGALLAAIIGWERELHGRPAGIRTHMLIAVGVILFTQVSMTFDKDAARIAAQVVTGIGFLGAGSILRMGAEVKGLTSAASIWAVAAISMAIALGGAMLAVAVVASGLALITLTWVDRLERKYLIRQKSSKALVELDDPAALGSVIASLESTGCLVHSVLLIEREPRLKVEVLMSQRIDTAMASALQTPGVSSLSWIE